MAAVLGIWELLAGLSPVPSALLADGAGSDIRVDAPIAAVLGALTLLAGAVLTAARSRVGPPVAGLLVLGVAEASLASASTHSFSLYAWTNALIAVATGVLLLRLLLARLPQTPPVTSTGARGFEAPARDPGPVDRRSFLVLSAGAALVAAVLGGIGVSSSRERSRAAPDLPGGPGRVGRAPTATSSSGSTQVPVEPGTVVVPTTIDPSGSTDVGAELSAWFARTAPGARTIRFQRDGLYRIDDGPVVLDRPTGVVLDFDGAALARTRVLDQRLRYPRNTPFLALSAPTGVTVRNLRTEGVNTNSGMVERARDGVFPAGHAQAGDGYLLDARGMPQWIDAARSDLERGEWGAWVVALAFEHSIQILDGIDVVIESCQLTGAGGDGVYVGGAATDGITIRGVTVRRNGRQGIAVVAGHNIRIEGCDLTSRRGGVDIEPDRAAFPFVVSNVEIRECRLRCGLLAFPNQGVGAIDNVNIHHNQIFKSGTPLLQTTGGEGSPRTRYRFEDNIDHEGRKGPFASIRLQNTHDMVIARNVIPRQPSGDPQHLRAVQLEGTRCTNIDVRDNLFENTLTMVDDMVGGSTWTLSDNMT